jgi:hypothetical protein
MSSARTTNVAVLAAIAALAGVEHGIGEMLQGSIAPASLVFQSWPKSDFFRVLAGEPAMTIVPNLLVSGILAIIVSLTFLAWATAFVRRRNAGLALILLSVVNLLVGGGIAPLALGIVVGAAAMKIGSPLTRWRRYVPPRLGRSFAALWPWSIAGCLLAWLILFPGLSVIAHFVAVDGPIFIPIIFLCALVLLVSSILSGFAYDIEHGTAR